MRVLLFTLLLLSVAGAARAEDALRRLSTAELINRIATVEPDQLSLSQYGSYGGFIAEEAPRLQAGVIGPPVPGVSPILREIVRRGPDAVPLLLAHLDDDRPTRLVVGGAIMDGGFFMAQMFGKEYDARWSPPADLGCSGFFCDVRSIEGRYTVRVGDICFSLTGQIVGRNLTAVRYQPSAILVVNSPVQRPELARWTRKDWAGLTREGHRASLMSDVLARKGPRGTYRSHEALQRLRYYYPDTYAHLNGPYADARAGFEASEAARRR